MEVKSGNIRLLPCSNNMQALAAMVNFISSVIVMPWPMNSLSFKNTCIWPWSSVRNASGRMVYSETCFSIIWIQFGSSGFLSRWFCLRFRKYLVVSQISTLSTINDNSKVGDKISWFVIESFLYR